MSNAKTRKQANLEFSRPEDSKLYDLLQRLAHERRYPLATFILLGLHEAFGHLIPVEVETNAIEPPSLPAPQPSSKPGKGKPPASRRRKTAASVTPPMPVQDEEQSEPSPVLQIPPLRPIGGKELNELVSGRL